jgi:hypothetical protein
MSMSIRYTSSSATAEKMHRRNRHIQQYRQQADRLYCAQQYCAA